MILKYNHESVSAALSHHEVRGAVRSWSSGQTGSAKAKVFYDVVTFNDAKHRFSMAEAHAFLMGIETLRDQLGAIMERYDGELEGEETDAMVREEYEAELYDHHQD